MKSCRFSMIWFLAVVLTAGIFTFSASAQASGTQPEREMRAVWIASVTNIDWPSKKGLSPEEQKREYSKLLDDVQEMGMNAVIVQIKPAADAFIHQITGLGQSI
ncbi:UPF0748 protein YngK [Bacillus velezensis]|nr:UPF0748 protein YngK [Bacillus velezensis]